MYQLQYLISFGSIYSFVHLVDCGNFGRKYYIVATNNIITMYANLEDMKLKEVLPEAGEREISRIEYKKLDKNGRLYIDVGWAKKEFLVVFFDPVEGDKEKFLKVGRG